MKKVRADQLLNLAEAASGSTLAAVTVGPAGDPIILTAHRRNDGTFVHKITTGPNIITISPARERFELVQPLRQGEWLLVRRGAPLASEANFHVYDGEGRFVRSFHAGNDIADVQATPNGDIWVSFSDEGIYKSPESTPEPNGLVCFDEYGGLTFRYVEIAQEHGLPLIDDCHAINISSNEEAWLYYYADFPLVRLVEKRFNRIWPHLPVQGSKAFAVHHDCALFAGDYWKKDSLFFVSLVTMKVQEVRPVDSSGAPLKIDKAIERGRKLYFVSESILYAIDLADVLLDISICPH